MPASPFKDNRKSAIPSTNRTDFPLQHSPQSLTRMGGVLLAFTGWKRFHNFLFDSRRGPVYKRSFSIGSRFCGDRFQICPRSKSRRTAPSHEEATRGTAAPLDSVSLGLRSPDRGACPASPALLPN